MRQIDCFELKRWMDEDRAFALLDVLPKESFEEMRLPGARCACVYEMTFLDQVKETVSDPDAAIVVYGSSQSSRDTVDAALDESNTVRLCEMLKDFATRGQFLIITHARPTMTVADTLYGVTMPEAGVSRQVAVRFADIEAGRVVGLN